MIHLRYIINNGTVPVIFDQKGNPLGMLRYYSSTSVSLYAYKKDTNSFTNATSLSLSSIGISKFTGARAILFTEVDEDDKCYMYFVANYDVFRLTILYDRDTEKFVADYSSKKHYNYQGLYTSTMEFRNGSFYAIKANPNNLDQILVSAGVNYRNGNKVSTRNFAFTLQCNDTEEMTLLSNVELTNSGNNSNDNSGAMFNIFNNGKLAIYLHNASTANTRYPETKSAVLVLDDDFKIKKLTFCAGKIQSINQDLSKVLMTTSTSYGYKDYTYDMYDLQVNYDTGDIVLTRTDKSITNKIRCNGAITQDGNYLLDWYHDNSEGGMIGIYKINYDLDTCYETLYTETIASKLYGTGYISNSGICTSTSAYKDSSPYLNKVSILSIEKVLSSIEYDGKVWYQNIMTQEEYDTAVATSEDILGTTAE